MAPTRVLLADDHHLVRAGIRALLEDMPGMAVVGEAEDGRQALSLIAELQPDVVLLDIAMPGLNGLDAAVYIARDWPRVRVIILSMSASEEHVAQALRVGVAGYLLKGSRLSELELAVRAVARGEVYLSPAIAQYLVAGYLQGQGSAIGPLDRLTLRQREVLQLVAESRPVKEIAQILGVSPKTVEMHRAQLMERLGIHDVPGLVRLAIRAGLIQTGD